MRILAIETSCDETAASLLSGNEKGFTLHSNIVASQSKIHEPFGGVVPEVAARNHVETIIPVIKKSLGTWPLQSLDAVAVTYGPGLLPSLLIGVWTASGLSKMLGIRLLAINHIEAHLLSPFLQKNFDIHTIPSMLPALALVVSGGHTELILVKKIGVYEIIGHTLDDAAGECFDKVAKMLHLPYPGGPVISRLAESGDKNAIAFPRPMIGAKNFHFSFSGLKTAVRYFIEDKKTFLREKRGVLDTGLQKREKKLLKNICASFEQSVIDCLIAKTVMAAKTYPVHSILLSGGVSANKELRKQLRERVKNEIPQKTPAVFLAPKPYTGDNAAMIAFCAYLKTLHKNDFPKSFSADPSLTL